MNQEDKAITMIERKEKIIFFIINTYCHPICVMV